LVEEAVSVGDLVRLLRFSHGDANLVELTLPPDRAAGVRAQGSLAAWAATRPAGSSGVFPPMKSAT
ncbi:hypothetical protein ACWD49_36300, partial [Streptomyces sp. NPDC002530]